MIQRIQSLWLLLAAIGGFLVIGDPSIYKATLANGSMSYLSASNSLLLYALMIGIGCLCLIAIFLFKKRPTQNRLCIISILLAIAAIALEVKNAESYKAQPGFVKGTYQLAALLPILMIIFLIMAIRGIHKDQKLVKSLDRLR